MDLSPAVKKTVARWSRRGERLQVGLVARQREIGSRIGGVVRVPHPPAEDAPETVAIRQEHPLPAEWTARGAFTGLGWTEDDAVGWWAEAADPRQDAARLADFLAVGRGQAGVFLSDRRLAVVLPEKLLAPKEKSLLGRTVGKLLDSTTWSMNDTVVSLWETDPGRLRGVTPGLAGRSFPFPRVVSFAFADGSVLVGRTEEPDVLP